MVIGHLQCSGEVITEQARLNTNAEVCPLKSIRDDGGIEPTLRLLLALLDQTVNEGSSDRD